MGIERSSQRSSSLPSSLSAKFSVYNILLLCFIFCVITTFIIPSSLSSDPYIDRTSNSGKLGDFYSQKQEGKVLEMMKKIGHRSNKAETRRFLRGLGSSPPRCTSKCGRCTPCKPVHVPVPPGTPVIAEYYPEAWRCKCGNKLYMP